LYESVALPRRPLGFSPEVLTNDKGTMAVVTTILANEECANMQ